MPQPIATDWRDENEAEHVARHHIPFAVASRVFLDPARIEVLDHRPNRYNEQRWNTVGVVDGRCFHVTFAMEDGTAWIISARPAHRKERKTYGTLAHGD